MTRTQQIRARLEARADDGWYTNNGEGAKKTFIDHAPDDLAALLAVCEAAEAWEEAWKAFEKDGDDDLYNPVNHTLGKAENSLAAAVRAYREGGEKK